jgi:cyclase
MLKKRVAASLNIKDYKLVKGKNFKDHRTLNDITTAIKIFCIRDIDELIIQDINKNILKEKPDFNFLQEISQHINVPFVYGGGITSLDDAIWCLKSGADKVLLNTILYKNIKILKEISDHLGSQSVIASIDVLREENNIYCLSESGKNIIKDINPVEWAAKCQENGCGEILLSSINKEGTMSGYDLDLISEIKEKITIPLIVSGGAGSYKDLLDAFKLDVSAVVAASMYQFTQLTPLEAKKYLHNNSILVRDYYKYENE